MAKMFLGKQNNWQEDNCKQEKLQLFYDNL